MHYFYALAEVLARHIHAPFGRVLLRHPAVDATVQHGHIGVAEPLQSGCGESRSAGIIIAQHHRSRAMRHGGGNLSLKVATRDQARAGNVCVVVLAGLAHINQRERSIAFEQGVEGLGRDCRRHRSIHLTQAKQSIEICERY